MGVIGGRLGYALLRLISPPAKRSGPSKEDPFQIRSKLVDFFPPVFWDDVVQKTVVDFGCGYGADAIEMAKRGARRVIGIDIRESVLTLASERAEREGVADRCTFTQSCQEKADTVISVDAFEHFADPGQILEVMASLLLPGGAVWSVFGPPWYHPRGGHLFSVFPWAHLVFTETSLLRWRADFKSDGAERFSDVEGGLNQMTVHRFKKLISMSPLCFDSLELVPIRRLEFASNPLTQEFVTANVRCRLVKQ